MPMWFDMVAHIIPWLRDDADEQKRVREEAAEITAEQEALAPVIKEQNALLVPRAEINGFTEGFLAGFQAKIAKE